MKKALSILLLVILSTTVVFGQTKRTTRSTAAKPKLSVYKSTACLFYDRADCYYTPGKYTAEELLNTEILTCGLATHSVYWTEYVKRTAGMTEEQYNQKIRDFINTCPLVKGEFWETARKEYLKKFNHQQEMVRLQNAAYKDPSVLKSGPYSEYCKEYVDLLNGTDEELMAGWKKFVTTKSKNNADPQRIMSEFRKQANAADWKNHARKELIIYGWYNCINDFAHQGKFYKEMGDEATAAFRKLFVKIDEPEP